MNLREDNIKLPFRQCIALTEDIAVCEGRKRIKRERRMNQVIYIRTPNVKEHECNDKLLDNKLRINVLRKAYN